MTPLDYQCDRCLCRLASCSFLHLSLRCSASLSCAALLLQVVIKVWDMGGQEKYRGMWERYCRGVEVIV